jgi:HEAT repeat protein
MYAAATVFPVLVEAKETRVIAPLITLLSHNNFHRVGMKASRLLTLCGAEAVPALIDALSDSNSALRARVTVILAGIRDVRAVSPLIERLSDKEGDGWGKPSYVCDMAAMALKSIGTQEALGAFHKWRTDLIDTLYLLGNQVDSSTLWSVQELFQWDRDGLREVIEGKFDANAISKLGEDLSYVSLEILVIIGNSAAVAVLEHQLKNASDRDDNQMVETIIKALERIGTPEALEARWAAAKG